MAPRLAVRLTNEALWTASRPRGEQAESGSKKRILVVEDDAQSREVYSALLSEAGYQVDQAENALAAICSIVRAAPDLVLADIRMPIVDGNALVRELKTHRDSRQVPIVALTGHDSPEMRRSAIEAGYDGYITKPIDPQRFPEQIAKFLGEAQAKHAARAA